MIEQLLRTHFGIDAELLRQITEGLTYRVLLVYDVDVAEMDGAAVGLLERCDHAHQRRLACTVGTEETIHPFGDGEGHILQSLHTIWISLRDIADGEGHNQTWLDGAGIGLHMLKYFAL